MEENEKYTVEFLSDALNDMTEVVSAFVMLGSRQGAIRIKEKFNRAAEQIQTFPYSGVTVPDKKLSESWFRMVIAEAYLMFYKVFEDERKVVFYRVLNGKRNYPALMTGLHNDINNN